jgi:hypothetical protein
MLKILLLPEVSYYHSLDLDARINYENMDLRYILCWRRLVNLASITQQEFQKYSLCLISTEKPKNAVG